MWGGGALVVAVVALGLTLFFVLRGGDSKDDTSSPEATVTSFINAAKDGDREAGAELMTEELLDQVDAVGTFGDDSDTRLERGEVTSSSIDGDRATVEVAGTLNNGDDVDLTFELVKEGDEWLIDNFGIDQPETTDPDSDSDIDSDSDSENGDDVAADPNDVATAYLDAAIDDDTEAGLELCTPAFAAQVRQAGGLLGENTDAVVDYEIDPATVMDAQASVHGRIIADNGGDNEIIVELTHDGDAWKVSNVAVKAESSGPGGFRS